VLSNRSAAYTKLERYDVAQFGAIPRNSAQFCAILPTCLLLDRYDVAQKDAEAAVKISPSWPKAHGRLGGALAGQGDHGGAAAAFERAAALAERASGGDASAAAAAPAATAQAAAQFAAKGKEQRDLATAKAAAAAAAEAAAAKEAAAKEEERRLQRAREAAEAAARKAEVEAELADAVAGNDDEAIRRCTMGTRLEHSGRLTHS
jgi:hypothetical protein